MRRPAIAFVLAALALSGCTNPDASIRSAQQPGVSSAPAQNAGEPAAPPAPSAASQAPAAVQSTPSAAAGAVAGLYVNWSYRTLVAHQRMLAAMAVGAARLSEQEAAASAQQDTTIARGQIYNRGQLVAVAPDELRPGWWAILTREQTGGDSQYEGLPAAYHVTLAEIVRVPGGYAVSEWLPQG